MSTPASTRLEVLALLAMSVESDNGEVRKLANDLGEWCGKAAKGQAGSLEGALGLRQHGGVSAGREQALTDRDAMLRRLHRLKFAGQNPTAAAAQMALSAQRYEADRWPRDRDSTGGPSAEPAASWWRMLRSGVRIPKATRITQILSERTVQDPL